MSRFTKFLNVLKFFWEHADEYSELLHEIPVIMKKAGKELKEAGEDTQNFSRYFGGSHGNEQNAAKMLNELSEATENVYNKLNQLTQILENFSEDMKGITIPKVSAEKKHFDILNFDVVVGFKIDREPILTGPASRIKYFSEQLEANVNEKIHKNAQKLLSLSNEIDNAANRAYKMGEGIKKTGELMGSLSE